MLLLVTLKALLSVLLVNPSLALLGLSLTPNVLFVLVTLLRLNALRVKEIGTSATIDKARVVAFLKRSGRIKKAERPQLRGSVQQDDRSNNNT
jgi:hypothetical protein